MEVYPGYGSTSLINQEKDHFMFLSKCEQEHDPDAVVLVSNQDFDGEIPWCCQGYDEAK